VIVKETETIRLITFIYSQSDSEFVFTTLGDTLQNKTIPTYYFNFVLRMYFWIHFLTPENLLLMLQMMFVQQILKTYALAIDEYV
jgi:hypothetical protein